MCCFISFFNNSLLAYFLKGFSSGSDGKESACSAGDLGSTPELGRSSGGGHGYPLQYSCQENSMDRGGWGATVQRVTQSRTKLKQLRRHTHVLFKFISIPYIEKKKKKKMLALHQTIRETPLWRN